MSLSMRDKFFCPEESIFYSYCLEMFVLRNCTGKETIVEFGSGDGTPVLNALSRTKFDGLIYGFEINSLAYNIATSEIEKHGLNQKYVIYNKSFFEHPKLDTHYLVSNPPFLPAADSRIDLPSIYGGEDGSTITKDLLSLDYENVMFIICSYSNPEGIINYALDRGYYVSNFMILPLKIGYYSSEPKVKDRITELQTNHKAFCSSDNTYFLSGVMFRKQYSSDLDFSSSLLRAMTCL